MSENTKERRKKGKKTRFPVSLFFIHFGFLLLMSGLHSGLIVLMGTLKWNDTVQSIVPIVYWASVAFGLTMYTRYRMKQTYDEPMQMLAELPPEWPPVTFQFICRLYIRQTGTITLTPCF